jgi:hypothetical protein
MTEPQQPASSFAPSQPAPPPAAPGFSAPPSAPQHYAPPATPTGYAPPAAPTGYAPPAAPTGYAPPAAPQAYAPPSGYQAPGAFAGSAYPAPDQHLTQQSPDASAAWTTGASPTPQPWAEDDTVELVGKGLLFSLGGVVVGIVAAVALWQMNFVAALSSLVMAYSCVWLYTKGAGRSPRKGALPLLAVILVGIFASLAAAFASDAIRVALKIYPGNSGAQTGWVLSYLTNPAVWQQHISSVVMYLVFAGLGAFGIFVGLAKARRSA